MKKILNLHFFINEENIDNLHYNCGEEKYLFTWNP